MPCLMPIRIKLNCIHFLINKVFSIGIEGVDLKKRGKCIDDINQAFNMQDPKWTPQQMKNVKSLMGLANCQRYKIEEKLTKINLTKWSPEQLKTPKKITMTFRIQTKLIGELKEILSTQLQCPELTKSTEEEKLLAKFYENTVAYQAF